jgi:GntR family transcriptional regulator / MocR family aminotransferase
MGTFSKILSPALRVAYMMVPPLLQERLTAAMEQVNLRTAVLEQVALAGFIEGNLLDRHIYRMKKIYEKKRAHIISELHHAFGRTVAITGENAGMHVLAVFSGIMFAPSDFQEFRNNGVEVDWAEDFAIVKGRYLNKLVLGYGSLSLEQITEGVRRLKEAVSAIKQGRAELAAS